MSALDEVMERERAEEVKEEVLDKEVGSVRAMPGYHPDDTFMRSAALESAVKVTLNNDLHAQAVVPLARDFLAFLKGE